MANKPLNLKPVKKQTLAEKVATSIEELILDGSLQGGDALPTEPEIAQQFGVSRAVVRDATRMLAARGLVEAQHGKGVFVTHTQVDAFGEALLLALRRMGASNWDVAQFEQLIYPEIVALAAKNAIDPDIENIQNAADLYLTIHAKIAEKGPSEINPLEYQRFQQSWLDFIQAVFDAAHNKLFSLLARPLTRLHSFRSWEGLSGDVTELETRIITAVIDLIKSRNPEKARRHMQDLMSLPAEAVSAMQQTEVAVPTTIVLQSNSTV